MLEAFDTPDHAAALAAALSLLETGLPVGEFLATRNLSDGEAQSTFDASGAMIAGDGADRLVLSEAACSARRGEFLSALDKFHETNPDRLGPAASQLRRSLGRYIPEPLFDALVAALVADDTIASDGMLLHRPAHQPGLTGDDARHWALLQPVLEETPEAPPVIHDLAANTGLTGGAAMKTLRQAVRMGMAVQIAGNRFFTPAALRAHADTFAEMIEQEGTVGVSDFRKAAGIGRNLAVEVLEYFDRLKLSQRDGNVRHQVKTVEDVFGSAPND